MFVAFLSEQINYEEFQKGAVAINTLNLMDFKRFLSYDKGSHISLEECTEFIGVGLMFLYTEEILLIKNDDRQIYEDYILRVGDMKYFHHCLNRKNYYDICLYFWKINFEL